MSTNATTSNEAALAAYAHLEAMTSMLDKAGNTEFAALARGVMEMRRCWLHRVAQGQAPVAAEPPSDVLDYFLWQTERIAEDLRAEGLHDSAALFAVFGAVHAGWRQRIADNGVPELTASLGA